VASKFLQPTSSGFRHPTDTVQMNGNIYNQPRMAYLGGMDKTKEPRGYYTNNIQVKKPGQTIAK
jgi:hypothetical protein